MDMDQWTEEDVREFRKQYEDDDSDDEQPPVHPGAVMVGIVLFFTLLYSLYLPNFEFASLNLILLVVLALGSKAMN